jgi:hypothetical protein
MASCMRDHKVRYFSQVGATNAEGARREWKGAGQGSAALPRCG